MADYKKMYLKLFNKVTDVIGELQQVQQETEELYIKSSESDLTVLRPKPDNNPKK